MKKYILFIICVVLFQNIMAQQIQFNGSNTYVDNNLTFKCEFSTYNFILSNIHDFQLTDKSRRIPAGIDDIMASDIARTNTKIASDSCIIDAFYNTFTIEEIANISNLRFGLSIVFDNDGDILRLALSIPNVDITQGILASKYAQLYREIKTNLKFKVTDKRLYYNYVFISLNLQKVKERERLFNSYLYE